MTWLRTFFLVYLFALVLSSSIRQENLATANDDTARFVRRAVQAELDGDAVARQKWLKAAIESDPDLSSARWHSGQVQWDSEKKERGWLEVQQFEKLAASNADLAEYKRMRAMKRDDAKGNEDLALWCMRHGMPDRAKVHWARVLKFQPNHRSALRRLGLKNFEGRWLTRDQIATVKAQEIEAAKLARKWSPVFAKWRTVIPGKNRDASAAAVQELKKMAAPELVGLMETQLSGVSSRLSTAVVDSLAEVNEQVATESLIRHAILSKWSSVRSLATEHLKSRSPHGYVPILIDAMMSPYEFQAWSIRSPLDGDHIMALNYSVGQKGKHSDQLLQGSVNFLGGRDDDRADEIREEMQERIEKLNEEAKKFNEPIVATLQATTGQEFGSDPSQWNDWWNNFNEYQVPDFRPVFTSFRRPRAVIIASQPFSCFPAGVMVSTETGLRPIERIKVGDKVLSENAVTGELTYKPVVETTVRKSDSIVRMAMNHEELLVTCGHPIWVNGRQWQMAKQVRPGDQLHGANGPVVVDSIEPVGKEANVYNLVVGDFGTYFVGKSRVLVHDNSIYTPPGVLLPGQK